MARAAARDVIWTRASRRLCLTLGLSGAVFALAACASNTIDQYTTATPPPQFAEAPPPGPPPGNGQVRAHSFYYSPCKAMLALPRSR
jgi:hypothetical protein